MAMTSNDAHRRSTELSDGGTMQLVEGVELIFRNLRYEVEVDTKGNTLEILHGISAVFHAGEMVAVMGASGAGKSTLMDIIAGRKAVGTIRGDLYYNKKIRDNEMAKNIAYVMQADVHLADLTVKETLMYAARFRMGDVTSDIREIRVNRILQTLEMEHIQDSLVGDPTSAGISGGQRKRLSIGVEIINLPSLIFLDEPTSGLDSEMSFEVIQMVRKLTDEGRTTVTTIHQPSSEIFDLFDKLILLDAGNIIYCGPAENVVSFFSSPPMDYELPSQHFNPANFAVQVAMGKAECKKGERTKEELRQAYENSSLYRRNMQEVTELLEGVPPVPDAAHRRQHKIEVALSRTQQYACLFHRQFKLVVRQPLTRILLRKNVAMALLIGSIFYDLDEDYEGANSRYSMMFVLILAIATTNIQAIATVINFRALFYRERAASCYTTLAYYTVLIVGELPQLSISALALATIPYWMSNLRDDFERFLFWAMVCAVVMYWGYVFILFCAAVAPTNGAVLNVFPVIVLFLLLFSGFMISKDEVPAGWSWGPVICPLRWAFESVSVNTFEDTGYWQVTDSQRMSDEHVLAEYDFEDSDRWDAFWWLLMIALLQTVATFFGLRFVNWDSQ